MERSIRKEARSSSIDNTTCSSTDLCQPPSTQTLVPSTDTRLPLSTEDTHLPSTDIFHPTSIDTSVRRSIDTEPRDMVATLTLVRDDRGNLHDQEGHLRNAAVQRIDALGAAIPDGEGREAARRRFRSRKSDEFRRITLVSINAKPRKSIDRGHPKSIDVLSWISIDKTLGINHILQSREDHDSRGVRSKTPTSSQSCLRKHRSTFYPTIDRHQETVIDRQPLALIDRRAPITYRVQMPKIDVARFNALRPKPKPSENPLETVRTPSDDGVDPMEVDRIPTGRTLRRRNEKVAKHLKRGANEKEKERIIAACHETEYSASIKTHTATSMDSAHPKSTDAEGEESVDIRQGEWENDYYIPTMATHTMHTEEYDEYYEEERVIEQRATLDEEDRLLHHSSWKKKSPSIDRYGSTSIDTQPHQPNHLRASTDNAYFPSIDTNVDATRDGD
ncbi:hypothetical protein DY000_02039666 [Brassica cretica]|uniref:Uncharacterized protein n=1 Tax=Brassica cretica TaxID=69181 RepID=A0ABQ7B7L1_BRACR|nr:hypothetical protein DY000_02039666 [Brassica cretica]